MSTVGSDGIFSPRALRELLRSPVRSSSHERPDHAAWWKIDDTAGRGPTRTTGREFQSSLAHGTGFQTKLNRRVELTAIMEQN